MTVQPVVRVTATADEVLLSCSTCPDGDRLPLHPLAVRIGVRAFLDEHERCGPALPELPELLPAR